MEIISVPGGFSATLGSPRTLASARTLLPPPQLVSGISPNPEAADPALLRWFRDEVQSHEPLIRNWLRVRFPALRDIDDVVQDSFLRVWRRVSETGPLESPRAYLFVVARNLASDTIKSAIRANYLGDAGRESVPDEGTDTPESVARIQEIELLHVAVNSLPERCRQVFVLHRLHGLTIKQTASQLGIAEKTVEAHHSVAMHKCTAFFQPFRAESTTARIVPSGLPTALPTALPAQHA